MHDILPVKTLWIALSMFSSVTVIPRDCKYCFGLLQSTTGRDDAPLPFPLIGLFTGRDWFDADVVVDALLASTEVDAVEVAVMLTTVFGAVTLDWVGRDGIDVVGTMLLGCGDRADWIFDEATWFDWDWLSDIICLGTAGELLLGGARL